MVREDGYVEQQRTLNSPASLLSPDSFGTKIRKTVQYYILRSQHTFRDLWWAIAKPRLHRPIFVVGCSRSGTTVVYRTLSLAPGLASLYKETHDFWNALHPLEGRNWDSHALDREDASEQDRHAVERFFYRQLGARRFVDKANQNCFRIPYLHALFPDAWFVYVKRDGRDNINSLIHGWKRPEEYATWSTGLPAAVKIEDGLYKRWCFFLFPGWRAYVDAPIETVCARQWIEANKAVLTAKGQVPRDQWIEIRYEDVLNAPVRVFRDVYERLDLPFSGEVRRHCENVVSRPYNAFSRPRLQKWKEENRDKIERILPEIESMMIEMGYETEKGKAPTRGAAAK